jgi:Ca-activated chloride channel family protein
MRDAIAPIVVCAVLGTGPPAQSVPPGGPFRSGVELVVAHATVTDRDGRVVTGLQRDDFSVFDDEQPRPIEQFRDDRVPVSLGVVLDTSMSMAGARFQDTLRALDLLFTLLDDEDEVFVYTFGERASLRVPWTRDYLSVRATLGAITPTGNTALFRAVLQAIPVMERARNRKKAMVIFSDGNDREMRMGMPGPIGAGGPPVSPPIEQASAWESYVRRETAVDRLSRAETLVYALGVGSRLAGHDPLDTDSLQRLTDPTGGYTNTFVDGGIQAATAQLASELRAQYLIGFAPARPPDGKFHRIRVVVKDPSYRVRARIGYLAARR